MILFCCRCYCFFFVIVIVVFYRRCCCFRRGNWCKQWRGLLLLLEWIKHPLLRWRPQEKKSNQLRKCHLGEAFYHFKSTMIFISSAMFSLAALEKKSNQLCKCHPWTHLRSLYGESRKVSNTLAAFYRRRLNNLIFFLSHLNLVLLGQGPQPEPGFTWE